MKDLTLIAYKEVLNTVYAAEESDNDLIALSVRCQRLELELPLIAPLFGALLVARKVLHQAKKDLNVDPEEYTGAFLRAGQAYYILMGAITALILAAETESQDTAANLKARISAIIEMLNTAERRRMIEFTNPEWTLEDFVAVLKGVDPVELPVC